MNQIDEYLKQVIARNGSDLHFIAGEPPRTFVDSHGETYQPVHAVVNLWVQLAVMVISEVRLSPHTSWTEVGSPFLQKKM